MLRQISVFLENKPGRLAAAVKTLADAGINIRALSLADTERFGILRIIVDHTDKALSVLKESGVTAKTSEVIGVTVPDKVGGLSGLLDTFEAAFISLEYLYAEVQGKDGKAVLILKASPADAARSLLNASGYDTVSEADL